MNKPNSPQKSQYKVELEEGQKYAFYTCGLSEKQAYCDGAHKEGAKFKPNVFVAEESGTAFLRDCKITETPPHCNGTHNTI